jgi:hypothetical protein
VSEHGIGGVESGVAEEPSRAAPIAEVSGVFELHVFVEPLDPDATAAARFDAACRGAPTEHRMKGLLLFLDYQQSGFVGVLQSSRYCTGALAEATAACARDAALLREAGFTVIREKVEAVDTNNGVPATAAEAASRPERYFEYHLLIEHVGDEGVITEADMVTLRGLSATLAARFQSPVPLSYNAFKPAQRFLNARTYGLGRDESNARVKEIEDAVNATGELRVVKVIREYICADTDKHVDDGWLEPLGEHAAV